MDNQGRLHIKNIYLYILSPKYYYFTNFIIQTFPLVLSSKFLVFVHFPDVNESVKNLTKNKKNILFYLKN